MNQSRWKIYQQDLLEKGLVYFFTKRIKKHQFLRRVWYMFRKPYVMVGSRKLFINKRDSVVSESLLTTGTWEPTISIIFCMCARKSSTIVDIGGNLGYFTILASTVISKTSRVYVFEPETINFSLLAKSVTENHLQNVTCEKLAIGNSEGEISLYIAEDNFGDHRAFSSGENRKVETVNMTTLDSYFASYKNPIDLLKIDIQGFEIQAFQGAKKLLKQGKIRVIMSELWPIGLQMAGSDWRDYIKLLQTSNFSIWEIDDESEKIAPFDPKKLEATIKKDPVFAANIIAILR